MQKAFTMIELVFAIVVIGILAAVAVPKLAPIIGSAQDAKVRSTIASVRSAISTERQKRILRGDFATPIADLAFSRTGSGYNKPIFDYFDTNTSMPILEYPIRSCKSSTTSSSCWRSSSKDTYYYYGSNGHWIKFTLDTKGHFNCDPNAAHGKGAICRSMTE